MTYYRDMLEEGINFQDHVKRILFEEYCLSLDFTGQEGQYNIGETLQGFEVKYDMKFKDTGNLWIEVCEKTDPNNEVWVDSGIKRNDNTWIYVIGDYDTLYVFSKKDLLKEMDNHRIIENSMKTSRGYLLKKEEAEKTALLIL